MIISNAFVGALSEFLRRPLTYFLVFILLLAFHSREVYAGAESDFYIFTVDTNVADGSPAGQFIMPSSDSNYQLQWEAVGNEVGFNSGGFIQVTSANQVIDFGAPGVYRIKVDPVDVASGVNDFDTLVINTDPLKFISVEQWGTAQWTPTGLQSAFRELPNFTGFTATDAPNLTNATSLSLTFYKAPLLVNMVGIETWDISNIKNLVGTFRETALANPNVSTWDTSNVTSMYATFMDTGAANPDTSGWNTSSVLDFQFMFYNAQMANPDTSGWDTSSVARMGNMFAYAPLANPDTSGWNTSNVYEMYRMFYQSNGVANPDTSGWDTSLVTNMAGMFYSAPAANPDTSGWDTSLVTSMESMFYAARTANPDTSSWDTSSVTDMTSMFNAASIADPDTSGWNTSLVTNMKRIFYGASVANPDTSSWDTSKVTNMEGMFTLAFLADPDTSTWNTSSVTRMDNMFLSAIAANPNTSGWDTSTVTTMRNMFNNASVANPNTSGWDTALVQSMQNMFYKASVANPDTSDWDTSLVTTMANMFSYAVLARPDTSGWDTSSVTTMSAMFYNASVANPDTSGWDTSSLTNLQNTFGIAAVATPDTSNWDVSNVTSMYRTFFRASSANPDTSGWDTSSVTQMEGMFYEAAIATPDTSGWDTSSVVDMDYLFDGATVAEPDVSNWDVSNVKNMTGMFRFSGPKNLDLSNWDTSQVTNMYAMFQDVEFTEDADLSGLDFDSVTNTQYMFHGTTMSVAQVDAVLIKLDTQTLNPNLTIHFGSSQYCLGESARYSVIDNDGWSISDGGKNCTVANLQEILEDSASGGGTNNGNSTSVTADQLAGIVGLTGVDPANEAEYQALIAAESGFSNPPTVSEVQAIIDVANASVNALAEVLEDSGSVGGANDANATPVTAAQLASITGITGVDPANEAAYQDIIANATNLSNPPTVADVQALIDAANASVLVLAEVLEDSASVGGASNANATPVTAAQLAAIAGITGVDPANEAEYQALIAAETGFSNPPTLAEVQVIIDAANNSVSALAEILEDSSSAGGANDANATPVTAAQLAAITGLTGVDPANEAEYQDLIANATNLSNPPTVAEVQSIIDAANDSVNALAEILEDSSSTGGAGDANATLVTAAQLASITGISGIDPANEAEYQDLIANATNLSNPPTVAEVQAIIDAANNSVNALAEILEDSGSTGGASDTNATPVTAAQLASITGITGVDAANEAEYQDLIANATNLSNPPTVAEVQALIDAANSSVNALAEILEDSGSIGGASDTNATPVTAAQLASITGITGVDPANEAEYQDLIANATNLSNPPTVAEVQVLIDAANSSVNALAEILEDSGSTGGAGDTNATPVTAAQLAGITGITGVDPANEAEYQDLIANATNLSNPPTVAEVQAIIDAANESINSLAGILEDSNSVGGSNNADAAPVTAAQLAAITGLTEVDPANEAEYQDLIANATNLSNPPTVAEVQAIIDAANASVNALVEILEDSSSTGGANDTNGTSVTAAQLAAITGITGVDPANEAEYQDLIANATNLSNPPTVAEVQAIIDAANNSVNALAEILEDSSSTGGAGDTNATPVTAAQLAGITGITGVDPANEAEYQDLIANATNLSNPPTVAEVQALIDAANDSVNSLAGILEDSNSVGGSNNADATPVTAAQLAAITGITGVDPANEAEYQDLIANATNLSNPPTVAEVQALIDAANESVNSLAGILEDSNSVGGSNNADATPVTAAQLAAITGITGVDPANEAEYQDLIANATNLSNPPKVAEVQALIDAANESVNSLAGILEDSNSVGGGNNADATLVTAAQLAAITGLTGVDAANEAEYQALIANATNLSSPPSVTEVQAIIDAANDSVNALAEILEDSSSPGGTNDTNATPVTAAQLAGITGITGVDPANEAEYQVLIANATNLSNPPTVAEVQALIDAANESVNSLAGILEDSNSVGGGNNADATPVTAVQLAAITGLTGVDAANEAEYQVLIANATNLSNPPTVAEVQALIDAANESVNSLASILEDSNSVGGGNNADATPVTAAQLAAISGLLGVDQANEAQYQALIAAETGFSNPPTVAEVQALIDVANGSVAALAEILEDSLSTGGSGDSNGTPVTAAQLSVITGITGVDPANEAEYQDLIANATNLSNPPTVAEVQALIDEANASVNAFAQILESSSSAGGSGDSDGSPVSAEQLAQITGITGVEPANEAAYQALIAGATNLSSPPTLAEVQALINEANTSESILLHVSTASNGGTPVTAAQLSSISGVEGVNPDNEAAYQGLMATGEGLSTPPTAEEIQRLIDSVNDADGDGLSDLIEQGVDTDNDGVTDEQDLDADNDGIRDQDEGAVDSDGDGVPNFRDLDSDNDGIFDWNESNADTQLISELDTDRNGVIDAMNAVGSNGLADAIESAEQAGEVIYTLSDVDGDGVADYRDRDSDNDGLFDSIEAGNADANLDGAIDDGFAPGTFDDETTESASVVFPDENGVLTGAGSAPRDTDQDTVPDYRDVDSDNDGMSDVLESFGASVDQDQDGRLDSFVDSDGDGVSDSRQGASQAGNDTDGDGQLDAVDTDSDGDGIADLVENGMQDIDGDGQLDDFVDRDGDGFDDGVEVIATDVLDLDGDGVPNYKDLDSDGDGFSDLEESGGVDANGDGSADSLTLGAALPDSDNDGIPDHLQTTYVGTIVTGQSWGGSGGCSVASVRGVAQSGTGSLRVDPLFIVMSVLSLLWLVSRRKRVSVNPKLILLTTLLPLFGTGCSVLNKPASAELAAENPGMSKQWYASAGVGVSRMKPDTSGVPGVGVDDQVDSGVQLSVGADIRPRLSLELHTSDLGASGLSSGGEIAYRVHGGSALLYARERSNKAKSAGLNAYARLGAGVLENTATGSVGYEQENQAQLLMGAGVEYAMGSSLSVRAEAVAFEQSVQYGQVGLVYRFGGSKRRANTGAIAAVESQPTPLGDTKPMLSAASLTSTKPTTVLTDRWVARAPVQQAAEPAMGAAMAKCHSVSNVKVYFDVNSARLTVDQRKQLDGLINTLSGCERARIDLLGHADSTGSAQLNEALSYRRAQAVVSYLTAQGIGAERTRIQALGETQPVQNNATATGRQNNRRVEFKVQ